MLLADSSAELANHIHLDAVPDPSERSAPHNLVMQPDNIPRRRILIADDDVDTALTLAELLDMDGFATRVAHDGISALEECATFNPDIVLLDIGMPELNGYEVAERIRARAGTSVRIIAISGWGSSHDRAKGKAAGFDVHLLKPVNPNQLMDLLNDTQLPAGTSPASS